MRPCTSADNAASYIGVFAGGGAGPLGVGPTMDFDASSPHLTEYLRKGIARRARSTFLQKAGSPAFYLSIALLTPDLSRILSVHPHSAGKRPDSP